MLRLTRESAMYASGAVAGKAFGLLLLPILTRALSPDEYGRLDVLSTLGSALVSALLLGLDTAVLRLAFEPGVARSRLFASWYAVATLVVVPTGLTLAFGARPLSTALFGGAGHSGAVALVGAIVILGTYQVIALAILRAQRRPRTYAALSGASLAVNAALTIALVLGVSGTATLALAALAGSLGLASVAGLYLVRAELRATPTRALARRMVALGLPLAPAVVLTWGAEIGNRAILLSIGGATEVAYLAVGLRFASVAGLAVTGFQLAWEPHAYAVGTDDAGRGRLAGDAHRALVGVAVAVVAIAAISPELVLLSSGPAYASALPALGLSLVATLGAALGVIVATPSALAVAMGDIGIARAGGVGTSVAANFALAPIGGGAGTAGALALGQIVTAALVRRLGSERPSVPVPWRRVLTIVAASGAVAVTATLPEGGAPPALRGALLLAFAALLFFEGSAREAVGFVLRGR